MNPIEWQDRGRMSLCIKGRPSFPHVEAVPGLYKLTLDNGWLYFGEAGNLQNRLGDYRTPTSGVIQEHRLNAALKEAGGAKVEIYTQPFLKDKGSRCTIETDAVRDARARGYRVLNGSHVGERYCMELDIQFHEAQITKLRARIQNLASSTEPD